MTTIRVALAEDNVLLREGVSRLVAANPDFELAGAASDLPGLLALIESSDPDVVITDIRMPPTGRDEGIRRPPGFASTAPASASWCSASTPRPVTPWPCSSTVPRAAPTC